MFFWSKLTNLWGRLKRGMLCSCWISNPTPCQKIQLQNMSRFQGSVWLTLQPQIHQFSQHFEEFWIRFTTHQMFSKSELNEKVTTKQCYTSTESDLFPMTKVTCDQNLLMATICFCVHFLSSARILVSHVLA